MAKTLAGSKKVRTFAVPLEMVPIVQLVRASDCGSEGRGFESHWAPYGSLIQAAVSFYPHSSPSTTH